MGQAQCGTECAQCESSCQPEDLVTTTWDDRDGGRREEDCEDIIRALRRVAGCQVCCLPLVRSRLLVPHNLPIFTECYQAESKIGEGSYGNVFQAVARRPGDSGWPMEALIPSSMPALLLPHGLQGLTPRTSGVRRVAVKVFSVADEEDVKAEGQEALEVQVSNVGAPTSPAQVRGAQPVPPNGAGSAGLAVATWANGAHGGRAGMLKCRQAFEVECAALACAQHPHIVRLYESFKESDALYIVLEHCRGGDLYGRLKDGQVDGYTGGLEEPVARGIFWQMLYAVSYLHGNQVAHRDIKCENVLLLDEVGCPGENVVKLCDFGTAVHMPDPACRIRERVGTLSYAAPEVHGDQGADLQSDDWSLGVVLYVSVVGGNPFRSNKHETREDTKRRILNGDFEVRRQAWGSISPSVKDLISGLLLVESGRRLTTADAMQHGWPCRPQAPEILGLRSRQLLATDTEDSPSRLRADVADAAPAAVAACARFALLDHVPKMALVACALQITEEDVARSSVLPWYELFVSLDTDADGKLGVQELAQGLKDHLQVAGYSIGLDLLQSLVQVLDIGNTGALDWADWLAIALLSIHGALEPEVLITAFRALSGGTESFGCARLLELADPAGSEAAAKTAEGLARWASPDGEATLHLEDLNTLLRSVAGSATNIDDQGG